jgi:hypothetical protein
MPPSRLCSAGINIARVLRSHKFNSLWFGWSGDIVLILHMSLPVVLPREPFSLRTVLTVRVVAVESLRVVVFVIDVALKMGLGPESLPAFGVGTLMWSFVVACVMTVQGQ